MTTHSTAATTTPVVAALAMAQLAAVLSSTLPGRRA